MEYVQLNSDNSILRQLYDINTEWDTTHFCKPSSLTVAEATYFRVHEIIATPAPTFNISTQTCVRDGIEFANGQWRYKWLVSDMSVTEIAARLETRKVTLIKQIDAQADQIIRDCIGERATQYQRAEAQARSYIANQSGSVPQMIQALMPIKNQTALQVATDIIAQADAWVAADNSIYANRIRAKELIRVAQTENAIGAGLAQWGQFEIVIRNQLGV